MITYDEIKTELAAGLTEQEIADKYAANLATVRDIPAESLQSYLAHTGLLLQDFDDNWIGYLVSAVKAANNADLTSGVLQLINQLKKEGRQVIQTTNPMFGAMIPVLVGVVNGIAEVDTVAFQSFLDSLSGGLRYGPQVTLAEVQRVRAEGEAIEARETMQQLHDGLYRTHVQPALETGTVQDVIDAYGLVIAGMRE